MRPVGRWLALIIVLIALGAGAALILYNTEAGQRDGAGPDRQADSSHNPDEGGKQAPLDEERPGPRSAEVRPTLQTVHVAGTGDVADMAVVWLHPTDPAQSLILAGSKDDPDGGLHVWEMDGATEVDFLPIGAVNSIDIRYEFPYDGGTIDLVGLTNRSEQEVQFFTIEPETREVVPIGSHTIDSPDLYGFTLAHDQVHDRFYSIPNTEDGIVEQWEISAEGPSIDAAKVRTIDVGSQTEGAVSDDAHGWMFIGEEGVGIWRYDLLPSSDSDPVAVDSVSGDSALDADVEGLTLYHGPNARGYLIASSQGNDRFTVYERKAPHEYVGWFTIVANPDEDIDDVTITDGIFVTASGTSPQFPSGVFVAHDAETSADSTNYKLVPWEDIAQALGLREPGDQAD